MKLLPIPGAPGYRIDCENQIAYQLKGYLKKINDRTKYKVVHLVIDGLSYSTTIFRMMYCAQHDIDITKLPKGTCIAMRGGVATAVSRQEIQNKRYITIKTRRANLEKWKRNTELINQYYDGNTLPLLSELHDIEKHVTHWFINVYGMCEERAEIISAYGVNKYMDRLAEGFPSPYIMGSVIKYARGENKRIGKQRKFNDNMQVIEL